MTTPLVIYHSNCTDGFTAAWACWVAHPTWEFHPGVHGHPPPDVTGRDVYMLDFSYKHPVLVDIAMKAKSVTIIDHHKTAKDELEKLFCDTCASANVKVVFDLEKSGARLAWEYFHPDATETPTLVEIVEDRDLWRFNFHYTRAVSAAIFSFPYEFERWNALFEACEVQLPELIAEGRAIERKHHKDVAELVTAFKRRITIGGVEVWAANLPYTLTSDAGSLMCAGEPFAAVYWDTSTQRVFSLRSEEGGADVSAIAALYGGGGHKHSSGFQLPLGVEP